jgi:phosphoglycerate dehydrogenase-like enzyme
MSEDESIEVLKNADILIMGGNEVITQRVLENIPRNLQFIFAGIQASTAFPGTWEEVQGRVFATGGGQEAVIQTTLQQLIFFNPLRLQNMMAKNGKIPIDRDTILKNQTLTVVGAGTIGKRVMQLAKSMFKEVKYTGGRGEKPELHEAGFKYVADFGEAFSVANAVSIHLELNPSTEKSIASNQLMKMPKNSFLLNNARAGIISFGDMEAFLFSRQDIQVICDEFYVNGEEFRKKMDESKPNAYQQIINFANFWYTGHTANQGELTKRQYSEGALKILADFGYAT